MPRMQWSGKAEAKRKLRAIPARVKARIKPVMEAGAADITAMQRALVLVESGAGAHTKGSAHEVAHPRGTEKASIGWFWKGAKIIISAIPRVLPNLGLWIERGTRAGQRGGSFRYTYLRRSRASGLSYKRKAVTYARKIYRTHPGMKAHPFFLPAWHALLPGVRDRIVAAWRTGIADSMK